MGVWDNAFDVSLVGVEDMLVHTKTEEDAIALLEILSDCGYTWPTGVSLGDHSNWGNYAERTIYHVYAQAERVVRFGSRDNSNPDGIMCTFGAMPELVLPEEDSVGCLLL